MIVGDASTLEKLPTPFRRGFASCMRTLAIATPEKQETVFFNLCFEILGWNRLAKQTRVDLCQRLADRYDLDPSFVQDAQIRAVQAIERNANSNGHAVNSTWEDPFAKHDGAGKQQRAEDRNDKAEQPAIKKKPETKGFSPFLDIAAFHGLAGDVVKAIEPNTEAHPVAILLQFLTNFGNAVGRGPHYLVEADRHGTNLFVVLAGDTSKARKGTSAGRVKQIMVEADKPWVDERMKSGLSSGEGLIWNVRDSVMHWNPKEQAYEKVDPGVSDKRLMIVEPEFAGTLAVMQRPGNTLSPQVRQAWDGITLSSLTKNHPVRATDPHISIVGHVTDEDLRANLDSTSMANGYANRFLFARVRRVRDLPHGGSLDERKVLELGERTKAALGRARTAGRVRMTPEAGSHWEKVYHALSEGQPGLLGAVIGRAEAQTVRLALLYALLDETPVNSLNSLNSHPAGVSIKIEHLRAALAVWEYCETSARQIFGDLLGNPIADEILRALRQAGASGMTRKQISEELFQRHRSSEQIQFALDLLTESGKARSVKRSDTGGRPAEVWFATAGER
jgi:hypothetical protein